MEAELENDENFSFLEMDDEEYLKGIDENKTKSRTFITEEEKESSTNSSTSSSSSSPSSSSHILMGPPIGKPLKGKIVDQTNRSNKHYSTSSIKPSFSHFPPIPKGEFSIISARQKGVRPTIDCFNGQTIGCRYNRLNSSIDERPLQLEEKETFSSSSQLVKGIHLISINDYNSNFGSLEIRKKQLPSFEEMQKIKEIKEIELIKQKNKIIRISSNYSIDEKQRGRHIMLRNWWDKRMERKKEELKGKNKEKDFPLNSFENHDKIQFGGKIYQPNKFFESPQNPSPETTTTIEEVPIKSRLIWEAIQDGLISIETVIALPIDWEKICIEHYKSIGVLPENSSNLFLNSSVRGSLSSTLKIENPMSSKMKKSLDIPILIKEKGEQTFSSQNQPRILLQYLP